LSISGSVKIAKLRQALIALFKMAGPQTQSKRTKLLADDSDDEVQLDTDAASLKINEDYAKRFEYNKKREEKVRLEEKYGTLSTNKRKRLGDQDSDDEDDSTDESEDDDAELVTEDLDQEIFATLNAIKSKDPRVYDKSTTFFSEFDAEGAGNPEKKKADKPLYLQDYHRQNLLAGQNGAEGEEDAEVLRTYQQEQDALKRELVGSMHATNGQEGSDDEDGFMVKKAKSRHEDLPALPKKKVKITDADVKEADKDPESYLSNFMAARAWLPGEGSGFQAMESDDSDDDARADAFEEAYNLRFEDPKTSNEKLQSFARDVGKYGARREEKTGRQLAREREKAAKDAAKRQREEDLARLRKLKIEEAEEKLERIKDAAGLHAKALNVDQWRDLLEGDFDDGQWEEEMNRRFGEDYYAEPDAEPGSDDEDGGVAVSSKRKKPKWEDDIGIDDLIPDFDDGAKPTITLSDDDDDDDNNNDDDNNHNNSDAEPPSASSSKKTTSKAKPPSSTDAKRAARKQRRQLEDLIDSTLPIEHPTLAPSAGSSKVPVTGFRYRATSPTSFGLSARDILFADDTQLNAYAGLKKMAAFRDEEKKRRDKKKFSKKARLKQWRRETFGDAEEPSGGFERVLGGDGAAGREKDDRRENGDKDGGKKKKRKHKKAKA
jgi:protein KRI1